VEALDVGVVTQISLSAVGVDFGATTLFSDITFTIAAGERWGIVGRNGTGKSTLFRLLTGEQDPTRGVIARQSSLTVSLLEQHRDFGDAETIWEVAAGPFAELLALERSLEAQAAALGEDSTPEQLDRYGKDLERFEREGGYEIAPRVDAILHGLGFDPATARNTPVAQLSGGERGRLGLARQLASAADVLLLDEPTNHLDLETTQWLEEYLRGTSQTVLLVSHDRAFLAAVANHVLHFEAGTATPYTGGYEAFVQLRAEAQLTQQRAFDRQQRQIAKESDYIARNIAGQNSKQAKGRRKRLERLPRLSAPQTDDDAMAVRFTARDRGPDRVLIADHASVAVGERTLVRDFTGVLVRGDVLGLVGPNGAGKSTLIRALMGEHPVASGELKLGASIQVAYYRQDLSQVPLGKSLYDVIADLRPAWERRLIQGHLGRFGFSGDEVQRRADTLSGGERARVALAMLMLSGANLLILDEPTNHLDVESIEALEDALDRYEGTVLLVSHDRELLRALTTRVWQLHGGHITQFDGGFAEWEVVTRERAHAASVRAAEEVALRKVREKQKTARREDDAHETRRSLRRAQKSLEELEAGIAAGEARVSEISNALEDPDLYATPEGVARAAKLGQELERERGALDALLERWSAASDEVQSLAGSASD
jgi:ATP-binding cassette subfamily F protein 3